LRERTGTSDSVGGIGWGTTKYAFTNIECLFGSFRPATSEGSGAGQQCVTSVDPTLKWFPCNAVGRPQSVPEACATSDDIEQPGSAEAYTGSDRTTCSTSPKPFACSNARNSPLDGSESCTAHFSDSTGKQATGTDQSCGPTYY